MAGACGGCGAALRQPTGFLWSCDTEGCPGNLGIKPLTGDETRGEAEVADLQRLLHMHYCGVSLDLPKPDHPENPATKCWAVARILAERDRARDAEADWKTPEQHEDWRRVRGAAEPRRTLRVPTGIVSSEDGLNEATGYVEVSVVIDPTMTRRGEVRRGFSGQVIALREWDERVLLHEALHVALGWVQPPLLPEQEHPVVCQVEVALWEMGWRLRDAEARRVVERLRKVADWLDTLVINTRVYRGSNAQVRVDAGDVADRIRAALAEIEEGSP